MRKLFIFLCLFFALKTVIYAQPSYPIHWSFSAEKTGENTYLVHCTATIDNGWHLYSQSQPDDAIAQPTKIEWVASPLIVISGKAKEVGQMEHFSDTMSGIEANQYQKKVDFEQTITLKGTARVKVMGKITFQICNDEMCLSPKTIPFDVMLP